jgi:hypothetical protein
MTKDAVTAPVELTDAELDAVTGGALVTIVDFADVNQNDVAVSVNAAAAVAALGAAAGAVAGNNRSPIIQ